MPVKRNVSHQDLFRLSQKLLLCLDWYTPDLISIAKDMPTGSAQCLMPERLC